MTNAFYNHTSGVPVSLSRGVSALIRTEYDSVEDGFDIVQNYSVDTGTVNAMIIAPPSALTTLSDGLLFRIKAANTITGPVTVNMGAILGTKSLRRSDGTAMSNEIVANSIFTCAWNATNGWLEFLSAGLPAASNGLPLTGGTMTGPINEAKGADIASSGTINLTTATGNYLHVTGTTTITGITIPVGATRTVIFDGALTLTHSASLLLPGGQNITTAANDRMTVRGDTAGAIVINYTKATGAVMNQAKGADIASAATINLNTATGDYVHVTGTTTITAITLASGTERTVVFDGVLTLTHNATTLILPGGANITTAAGDVMRVRGDGSGNVRVVSYSKASGYPVLSNGLGGTTTTSSVTLTSASAAAITVTPSTYGLYATLPDATTCTKAISLFSIYNAGDYDYGVKDASGAQLGWIRPRTGAVIGLADNSTSAGNWPTYGVEKIGITATYVNSTLSNMASTTGMIKRIAVDSNRSCFLFGGVDCYAIIYDASTQTWGSATLVRATIASGAFVGVLSATNQVMVCSCTTTTGLEAVCLTISGTSITVETATKSAVVLAGNWASFGQLIAVSTSFVLSYGRATNVSAVREITLSGVTPTIRSENALPTANVTTSAQLYASGTVVRTLIADLTATFIYCKPWTISGGALMTGGTQATLAINGTGNFKAFLNGNGNIVCLHTNTTAFAGIFKLTGTVEAVSSATLGTVWTTDALTNAEYASITSSKTAVCWQSATTTYRANIITDSAGTISNGTPITGTVQATIATWGAPVVSGNSVRFAGGTGTTSFDYQLTFDCSGASPSLSSAIASTRNPVSANESAVRGSDSYGVRSTGTLFAGSASYSLGSTNSPLILRITANDIRQISGFGISVGTGNGVVGASNNETWACDSFNAGTTGIIIQRIEAAA